MLKPIFGSHVRALPRIE